MAQPPRVARPDTAASDIGEGENHTFHDGQGTEQDPFIVEFQANDPENPMNWGNTRKWFIAFIATLSVFVVTFTSSAYAESSVEIIKEFKCSTEVFVSGVSVYVLGFAIGPAAWAPLVSMPCPFSHDFLPRVHMYSANTNSSLKSLAGRSFGSSLTSPW